MIPIQNVNHLMLDLDTRNAVKTGVLKVVPVIFGKPFVATGEVLGHKCNHVHKNIPKEVV